MIDFPVFLFIIIVGASAFFCLLGFMARSAKFGMFTIIGGMVLFGATAVTDNFIMGYNTTYETSYNNATDKIIETPIETEPILEPFTDMPKVFTGFVSAVLMLLGALIMRSEN